MKKFVASFPVFSEIFEAVKEQNYPKEMIKSLKNKNRTKAKAKITTPTFK